MAVEGLQRKSGDSPHASSVLSPINNDRLLHVCRQLDFVWNLVALRVDSLVAIGFPMDSYHQLIEGHRCRPLRAEIYSQGALPFVLTFTLDAPVRYIEFPNLRLSTYLGILTRLIQPPDKFH